MDVRKPLSALAALVLISACSKIKSMSDVMEDGNNTFDNKPCVGQKIENKYLVQFEDGRVESVIWPDDYESFKRDYVEPRLQEIRRVENDKLIQLTAPVANVSASSVSDTWGTQLIQADQAWAQGVTGQGVKVGVVDTWVDQSHPQLKNQFFVNAGEIPNNGVDDDGNGYVDDYYGYQFFVDPATPVGQTKPVAEHGTHVSGVIAADPSQGQIKGIAYNAKIIAAPFLNSYGSGSFEDALRALDYMKMRQVKVINASWGGEVCSTILRDKISELGNAGIMVVVAAGNSGHDLAVFPESPASFNLLNQITVAGSTAYDFLATWSNYSPRLVHLSAPGENILSTVPISYKASGVDTLSGTSMATPFVTATAALLWSARPNATLAQVKSAIVSSVDIVNVYPVVSKGRLNLKKALTALQQAVP